MLARLTKEFMRMWTLVSKSSASLVCCGRSSTSVFRFICTQAKHAGWWTFFQTCHCILKKKRRNRRRFPGCSTDFSMWVLFQSYLAGSMCKITNSRLVSLPRVLLCVVFFADLYYLRDDILGEGARSSVHTCIEKASGQEFAVKVSHQCRLHNHFWSSCCFLDACHG